jgi:hypothetical protein
MQAESPLDSGPRWGRTAGELLFRIWEDDAVAFHGPSCATHLLSVGAGMVLQALCEADEPLASTALWQLAFGDDPGDDEISLLNGILQRLAQSGLVTA